MAGGGKLNRGTSQGQRIDADVAVEPFVFIGEKQLQEARIDIFPGGR